MDKDIKLTFLLTDKQRGPFPVATESLCLVQESIGYRVKSIPFFIDDLSFDDVIVVDELEEGIHQVKSVIEPSSNSTVWIYLKQKDSNKLIEKLLNLGCGIESGVIDGYFAVNIPKVVSIDSVYSFLTQNKDDDYFISDYPSVRS